MMTLKNAAGYQHCGCRDCMETTIGEPGDFCDDCQAAGCEPDSECQAENAYDHDSPRGHGGKPVDKDENFENWRNQYNAAAEPKGVDPDYGNTFKCTGCDAIHNSIWSLDGVEHPGCGTWKLAPKAVMDVPGKKRSVASVRAANVSRLERHAAAARLIRIAKELMKVAGQSFLDAYMEAALWSTNDESDESGGEPMDKNYTTADIDAPTKAKMAADCEKFQSENAELLDASDLNESTQGYCFWMNRNGHGVGFWDRTAKTPEAEAVLEALGKASDKFGTFDLYVTDDGEIAGSGG